MPAPTSSDTLLQSRHAVGIDHSFRRLRFHHHHLSKDLSFASLRRWLLARLQHAEARDGELVAAFHLLGGYRSQALEQLLLRCPTSTWPLRPSSPQPSSHEVPWLGLSTNNGKGEDVWLGPKMLEPPTSTWP